MIRKIALKLNQIESFIGKFTNKYQFWLLWLMLLVSGVFIWAIANGNSNLIGSGIILMIISGIWALGWLLIFRPGAITWLAVIGILGYLGSVNLAFFWLGVLFLIVK